MSKGININKFFLRLQLYVFSLLILGTVTNILFQISNRSFDWSEVAPQFWEFFKVVYLPIALALLILHLLIKKVKYVKLYLYYNVWIKYVFKVLKRLSTTSRNKFLRKSSERILNNYFDEYCDSLILESFSAFNSHSDNSFPMWIQTKTHKNKPVFIRREHLKAKNFWPNWAFSVILLFNKLRFVCYCDDDNKTKIKLEIDLHNQEYGIYNNAGKAFLINRFLVREGEINNIYIEKADRINDFLKNAKPGQVLEIDTRETPFRWASGGILPIAHWKGKYWYVLFFRGIMPVGWNLPNGASENAEEYKNLHTLMVREFSEELILLNREPKIDDPVPIIQRVFHFDDPIFEELPEEVKDKITSKKFIKKHAKLRKSHDNLDIKFEDDDKGLNLERVKTPFEIEIKYNSRNSKKNTTKKIKDVIFSVNPYEFGIESISIYNFEMKEDDYPMFGEIWEVADCLLREPVLLISCDYVQEVFNNNKKGASLSSQILDPLYLGGKSLQMIPTGAYHIFDKDIEFRKQRINHLVKELQKCETALYRRKWDSTCKKLKMELEMHKRWLEDYEKLFKDVQNGKVDIKGCKHRSISVLCPVTWKTLELVHKYNILKDLRPK